MLRNALSKLYNDKIKNQYYTPVRAYVLNPKSLTIGELYGEVNPITLKWKDGLLGILMRTAVQVWIDWIQALHNIHLTSVGC